MIMGYVFYYLKKSYIICYFPRRYSLCVKVLVSINYGNSLCILFREAGLWRHWRKSWEENN
jgi:hypothetical protein